MAVIQHYPIAIWKGREERERGEGERRGREERERGREEREGQEGRSEGGLSV